MIIYAAFRGSESEWFLSRKFCHMLVKSLGFGWTEEKFYILFALTGPF